MCRLYHSVMWVFTGQLLSPQKFPSAGDGSIFVSIILLACPSKLMWSHLPCSSPLCHLLSISILVQSYGACLFCWVILSCINLFYIQVIKSLGDEKKLSINILCPKPQTLQVKCLTVACVAVMSSVSEYESIPNYTLMLYVYHNSSQNL